MSKSKTVTKKKESKEDSSRVLTALEASKLPGNTIINTSESTEANLEGNSLRFNQK